MKETKNVTYLLKKKAVADKAGQSVAHQHSAMSFSSETSVFAPYHLNTFYFRLLLDCSYGPTILDL